MASVLVYIHTDGVRATPSSLESLGEARRIASTLGASLYAAVAVDISQSEFSSQTDKLVGEIGAAGADKVVLVQVPALVMPTLWASCGAALAQAAERIRPLLIVFPADSFGRDIAPRLSARLGAVYVPGPSVRYGSRGEVVFSRSTFGATYRHALSVENHERALVITLTEGSYAPASGEEAPEVLVVETSERRPGLELVESQEDPGVEIEHARVVVTAGAGATDDELALCRKLADALGGEFGATLSLVDAGRAPRERYVGIGGRSVAPELYVVCAASGSDAHLGAVSNDAEIVAINSDARAPIFRIASYGIVGTVKEIVPSMISAVQETS